MQAPPRARAQIIRALRNQQPSKVESWMGGLPEEWRARVAAAIARPPAGGDSSDEEPAAVEQEEASRAAAPAGVEPAAVEQPAARPPAQAQPAAVEQPAARPPAQAQPAAVEQPDARPPAQAQPAVVEQPDARPPAQHSSAEGPRPIGNEVLDQGAWSSCSAHACAAAASSALAAKYGVWVDARRLADQFMDRGCLSAQWPGHLLARVGALRLLVRERVFTCLFAARATSSFSEASWSVCRAAGWRLVVVVAKWGAPNSQGRAPTHSLLARRWGAAETGIRCINSRGEAAPYPLVRETDFERAYFVVARISDCAVPGQKGKEMPAPVPPMLADWARLIPRTRAVRELLSGWPAFSAGWTRGPSPPAGHFRRLNTSNVGPVDWASSDEENPNSRAPAQETLTQALGDILQRGGVASQAAPAAPAVSESGSPLDQVARIQKSVQDQCPTAGKGKQAVLSILKFLCEASISNNQLSNRRKLCVLLFIDGEAPSFDANAWELLTATGGLLAMVGGADRDPGAFECVVFQWSQVQPVAAGFLTNGPANVMQGLREFAKEHAAALQKTTNNNVWKGNWALRCGEMMGSFKKQWGSGSLRAPLAKLFLAHCETPKPQSKGAKCLDVYLDAQWDPAPAHRDNNCYVRVPWKYYWTPAELEAEGVVEADWADRLATFIQGLYFDNHGVFQLELAALHLAFAQVTSAKMTFQIGGGGGGKHAESQLQEHLFGTDHVHYLDCGAFQDRNEWRKECDGGASFLGDIWKRFVVDEALACRVNYGFNSSRKFGESKKKALVQLQRRIICCRIGRAQFVNDPKGVDHSKGWFLKIPQAELDPFLAHCAEGSIANCLRRQDNLMAVCPRVARGTAWLGTRLSGGHDAPPGEEDETHAEAAKLVVAAHKATPAKPVLKEYLFSRAGNVPLRQNLVDALEKSPVALFQRSDANAVRKLLVNYDSMVEAMVANGGDQAFGSWGDWGSPFDRVDSQANLTQGGAVEWCSMTLENMSDVTGREGRLATDFKCTEKPDFIGLMEYAKTGDDRGQQMLEAYLQRCEDAWVASGQGSSVSLQVPYQTKEWYKRKFARGPAGQKLSREAREVAFPDHVGSDAPCCHPRLFKVALQRAGVYSVDRFPMLARVCRFYKQWRSALSQYLGVPVEEAKVEIIKIFDGARPVAQVLWLLKLCSEVMDGVAAVLAHAEFAAYRQLYADRPSPDYSRMAAVLSQLEDDALMVLITSRRRVAATASEVLLFDGCLALATCFQQEALVRLAVATANEASCVEFAIQSWPSTSPDRLGVAVLHGCGSQICLLQTPVPDKGNFLLTAAWWAGMGAPMADLSPEDLAVLTMQEVNDNSLYSSQRDNSAATFFVPVHEHLIFEEVHSGRSVVVVEDPSRAGAPRHVYGLRCSNRELGLFDPAAPALVQVMQAEYYLDMAQGRNLVYYMLERRNRVSEAWRRFTKGEEVAARPSYSGEDLKDMFTNSTKTVEENNADKGPAGGASTDDGMSKTWQRRVVDPKINSDASVS
ncbi:unnamed protein product [Prorocentrum cordatum]|uniref:Uncharacterized protein n=1 Tax=Prorocentrum cordatum TaxID=2364126 RepID=A0ABN9WA00_9DINO|nr:unnamed protein product [Polarella glacialis]